MAIATHQIEKKPENSGKSKIPQSKLFEEKTFWEMGMGAFAPFVDAPYSFSQIDVQPTFSGRQTNHLKIGKPGDQYEHEADRVANQVTNELTTDDDVVKTMESHWRHSFANVNIHDDKKSHMMANALNTHAFTIGNDIYFGQGQYDPASSDGQHLLAHELTHVAQQEQMGGEMIQGYGGVHGFPMSLEVELMRRLLGWFSWGGHSDSIQTGIEIAEEASESDEEYAQNSLASDRNGGNDLSLVPYRSSGQTQQESSSPQNLLDFDTSPFSLRIPTMMGGISPFFQMFMMNQGITPSSGQLVPHPGMHLSPLNSMTDRPENPPIITEPEDALAPFSRRRTGGPIIEEIFDDDSGSTTELGDQFDSKRKSRKSKILKKAGSWFVKAMGGPKPAKIDPMEQLAQISAILNGGTIGSSTSSSEGMQEEPKSKRANLKKNLIKAGRSFLGYPKSEKKDPMEKVKKLATLISTQGNANGNSNVEQMIKLLELKKLLDEL